MLSRALMGASGVSPLQFVGGAALSSSSATSTPTFGLTGLSGGIASSPSIGDIVIACVAFKDGTNRNIQCTTSGYTEVADLFISDSNSCQLGVYYKVLSAADTDVSFNIAVAVNSRFAVHVWRNPNIIPLDATTTTAQVADTGIPDAPSITTVTANAIVIAVGAAAGEATVAPLSDLTVPSGMENFFQVNASTNSCIGIASILRASSGAYDPPAFGGGGSSIRNSYCAATLALRPQ
jgi:hypothetical protein